MAAISRKPVAFDRLVPAGNGGGWDVKDAEGTDWSFDSTDQLQSQSDLNGNKINFSYDSINGHKVLDSVNSGDQTLTFTYDLAGSHITMARDSAGRIVNYGYNSSNELTCVADPMASDSNNGNPCASSDPASIAGVMTYSYGSNHQLASATDRNGHTFVTNTYDPQGRIVKQTDALGNAYGLQYEGNGTIVTDPTGVVTGYQYQGGNLSAKMIWDSVAGAVYSTTYQYDSNNNQTQVIDANGHETDYTYDANGNKLSQVLHTPSENPSSETTTWKYNAYNKVVCQVDPMGNVTASGYNYQAAPSASGCKSTSPISGDDGWNLTSAVDPLGHTKYSSYYPNGDLCAQTDGMGSQLSHCTLDANGNDVQPASANHTTTYTYNSDGNRITARDANGHTTYSAYTAWDQPCAVTNPLGSGPDTSCGTPWNSGQVAPKPVADTTITVYDLDGNVRMVTDALGNTTQYTYDPEGNRLSTTDAAGNVTRYLYNGDNQLCAVTDALAKQNGHAAPTSCATKPPAAAACLAGSGSTGTTDVTQYYYDGDGNRTATTNARGCTTTYTYNALGLQATRTDADGNTISFGYDPTGNKTSFTNGRQQRTAYTYDEANRVTQVQYGDGSGRTTTWTYNADGLPQTIADSAGGTEAFSYDAASQVSSVTQWQGTAQQAAVGYTYNAAGERTGMTLPNVGKPYTCPDEPGVSANMCFGYDVTGRETSVTDPGGKYAVQYSYDAANREQTATYANGDKATISYDGDSRVQSISYAGSGGSIFATYATGYDPNGNRKTVTDPTGTTTYTFDGLNRVTGASGAQPASYSYDGAGNLVSGSRATPAGSSFDAANQNSAFTYDADGNRTGWAAQGLSYSTMP